MIDNQIIESIKNTQTFCGLSIEECVRVLEVYKHTGHTEHDFIDGYILGYSSAYSDCKRQLERATLDALNPIGRTYADVY